MSIVIRKLNTLFLCALILLFPTLSSKILAQTASINAGTVYQTIDGFGAATAFLSGSSVPASVINTLYGSSSIGLKYIRMQIYPDYSDCVSWTGSASYCVSVSSGATIETADLANVKAAVANGAVVWATLWSPPGSMKDNGNFSSGGNFLGNSTNYTALATIEASFVTLLTGTYGIPVYAVSAQNEPNISEGYPSCLWTAQQFHDFVPYLRSALNAVGYGSTKIMVAEPGHWESDYASTAMNDSTVASDIGILAAHGYASNGNGPVNPPSPLSYSNVTSQHQWETEVSDTNSYDGSMTSGLMYALAIHQFLATAQVNAWNYWLISGDGRSGNSGLTDSSNNIAKRAYVMGNWARFVTGMVEIAATQNPQSGVYVTAFKNTSTGAFAIVAINTNSNDATQSFALNNISGTSMIPYVTDPNNDLAAQSTISVSSNSFSATLSASSVTTFMSRGNTAGAPTNLVGSVIQ
ncbi:MAG: hypothetical protein WCC26_03550 [Terracidiphilus sp.]